MAKMTHAHWRQWAEQWQRTGPELERLRRASLRNLKYNWRDVDALLEIGANFPPRDEGPMANGLVILQQAFMQVARKQGLLPPAARESRATYGKPLCRPMSRSVKTK